VVLELVAREHEHVVHRANIITKPKNDVLDEKFLLVLVKELKHDVLANDVLIMVKVHTLNFSRLGTNS
jgi:hypothetical protein